LDNRDQIVEFPQQRYTLANAASKTKRILGQGVLSPVRKIYLRGVDFDSQELVSYQHSGQTEIEERPEKRSKDRSET
jgi:hypothetical protein